LSHQIVDRTACTSFSPVHFGWISVVRTYHVFDGTDAVAEGIGHGQFPCLPLPAALLQTAADTPPVIEGASLPSIELATPQEHGGLDLFRFSPDGTLLAAATEVATMTWDGVRSTFGGEVIRWDPLTGKFATNGE
jgi:hypothetical protein